MRPVTIGCRRVSGRPRCARADGGGPPPCAPRRSRYVDRSPATSGSQLLRRPPRPHRLHLLRRTRARRPRAPGGEVHQSEAPPRAKASVRGGASAGGGVEQVKAARAPRRRMRRRAPPAAAAAVRPADERRTSEQLLGGAPREYEAVVRAPMDLGRRSACRRRASRALVAAHLAARRSPAARRPHRRPRPASRRGGAARGSGDEFARSGRRREIKHRRRPKRGVRLARARRLRPPESTAQRAPPHRAAAAVRTVWTPAWADPRSSSSRASSWKVGSAARTAAEDLRRHRARRARRADALAASERATAPQARHHDGRGPASTPRPRPWLPAAPTRRRGCREAIAPARGGCRGSPSRTLRQRGARQLHAPPPAEAPRPPPPRPAWRRTDRAYRASSVTPPEGGAPRR